MKLNNIILFDLKKITNKLMYICTPLIILLLVGLTIVGCKSRPIKKGEVYNEWSRTISQLGIFPIYPPREDVQVGDVFLLPVHPHASGMVEEIGGLGNAAIWAHSNVSKVPDLLHNFYGKRPSFPSTAGTETATILTDTGSNTAFQHMVRVPEAKTSIFKNGNNRRLREVAFPEYAVSKFTTGGVQALVPIDVLSAAAAFSGTSIDNVSVKIPVAESYGLPASFLLNGFFGTGTVSIGTHTVTGRNGTETVTGVWIQPWKHESTDIDFTEIATGTATDKTFNKAGIPGLSKAAAVLFHAMFKDQVKLLSGPLKRFKNIFLDRYNDKYMYVAVINEVFYTRVIDILIQSDQAQGGTLRLRPLTNITLEELGQLARIEQLRESNLVKNLVNRSGRGNLAGLLGNLNTNGSITARLEDAIIANIGSQTAILERISNIDFSSGGTTTPHFPGSITASLLEISPDADVIENAKRIAEFNKELSKQNVPGATFEMISASKTSIGLRRVFERPIAVGVRGMVLKIDMESYDSTRGFKVAIENLDKSFID